jgi:hypothetical protein
MNEGWGGTPQRFEDQAALVATAIDYGLPVSSDSLEMEALVHWVDIGRDQRLIGRRSPCHRLARIVCTGCPIRDECFEYAIAAYEPGIWGGTTERQRREERSLRRRRDHHRR